MRPRAAAAVACRIIALVLGIQVITQSISILILSGEEIGSTGRFWAIMGATAAVAGILWRAAIGLSELMTDGVADEAPSPARSTANVHAVALSIVGVLQIVQAIPQLIGVAASEGISPEGFGPLSFGFGLPFFDRGTAVAINITRIVLGILLIIGSKEMSRGLARRYPEPEPPATPPPPSVP